MLPVTICRNRSGWYRFTANFSKKSMATLWISQALSYIDFAVNGARRMSNLLTALLTYSRVANASPQKSPKADSRAAVSAALLNLSTVIDDTGASIEVGSLPAVQVPEIHLVQLFQNLIGNGAEIPQRSISGGERPRDPDRCEAGTGRNVAVLRRR